MLKTDANPEGTTIDVFDQIREGVAGDRSQYYHDLAEPFYGANRAGSAVSQGTKDAFWLMSMTVGVKAAYDCIKAFSRAQTSQAPHRRHPQDLPRRTPRPHRSPSKSSTTT